MREPVRGLTGWSRAQAEQGGSCWLGLPPPRCGIGTGGGGVAVGTEGLAGGSPVRALWPVTCSIPIGLLPAPPKTLWNEVPRLGSGEGTLTGGHFGGGENQNPEETRDGVGGKDAE